MTEARSKMGRPKKELTDQQWNQLIEMIRIQCTEKEICAVFDMHHETLNRICRERGEGTFSQLYEKHHGEGAHSLRRAQWKKAVDEGNPTMLIWLGKNMLGQSDKVEHKGDLQITLPSHADKL